MNSFFSKDSSKRHERSGSLTRQQIAVKYQWSAQTLKAKIKQSGIELPAGLISPKWQKEIFNLLGYPPGVLKSDYEDV
ncbi:MAG: hypothetical protein K9J45_08275 [Bacteroidales bacterium]|nr:hypothetical protein [Bacteroidales bacterium]